MKKVLLTFTLFWVKMCFKVCKECEREELQEIVKILNEMASNLSTVSKAVRWYMEGKANSQNYNEWLYVAESNFATTRELMQIAEKCITISCYYSDDKALLDQVTLAKAISENPSTTEEVIKKLKLSTYSEVTEIAERWIEKHIK